MCSDHNSIKLKAIRYLENPKYLEIDNTFLKNSLTKEEITGEIQKYFKVNHKENATYQNLCDTFKAVLRGNLTALNIYSRK